jgi:hypothetical protein
MQHAVAGQLLFCLTAACFAYITLWLLVTVSCNRVCMLHALLDHNHYF